MGMPLFYFHICNGVGFTEDQEGAELPDATAARARAILSARDVMTADLRKGELDLSSFIEVENEAKQLLFTISFEEAVQVTRKHDKDRPRQRG